MGRLELVAGDLFADRFEIESLAGHGGMGSVYRARDRASGAPVALKLVHAGLAPDSGERFAREAQLLAELRHPGIVSYVTHGLAAGGQPFLVMEWLEGEDLSLRLRRGPLSLWDCVVLIERVAQSLAFAHAQGVIHRDLKPSNLFLPGGDVGRVQILDFGLARRLTSLQALALTRTGVVMGTPEYMAPEQARGNRDLTPAVDLFSVGCILYECLTGQPPFVADHVAAVLARILFEDPVPIEHCRPGLPESLGTLVSMLLRKEPAERMSSASALGAAVAGLRDLPDSSVLRPPIPGATVDALEQPESEQALLSVVLAVPPDMVEGHADPASKGTPGLGLSARQALLEELRALALSSDFLINGALVVAVPPLGCATDQAAQAARAALLIKQRWPAAMVSMATGCGALSGRLAVGTVVDRAAALQKRSPAAAPQEELGVILDDLSAKLLSGRFTQTPQSGGIAILSEEREPDTSRPLLGRPTPCLGREVELKSLSARLASCIEESEPCAVVITAEPGVGKSRLRQEFLRGVAQRGEVTVVQARGEMLSAGAPYGILGQAVRRLCGLWGSEPLAQQQSQLAARIGQYVDARERARVTEFMGELAGVPFPDEGSERLLAARKDPRVMREQVRRAFTDWLSAECRQAPVLIVLDDLQWGDALSVVLLDEAQAELRGAPLMLLALGRPEVSQIFPRLWQRHSPHTFVLRGLSKRACERLIYQVLGRQVPAELVNRLVEQSSGNALFLEELIRATTEDCADGTAETVLAMLQARFGRLDAGARRVLRAAAIFGPTFWRSGAASVLGVDAGAHELAEGLATLVEREVIVHSAKSRLGAEQEFRFRHALMHEAAYGLVTEAAKLSGHRIAGAYLVAAGEPEPAIIADHFHRGGERTRAAAYYAQAAERALACYDLTDALDKAGRALACGCPEEARGRMLGISCTARMWNNEWPEAVEYGEHALPLLTPRSRRWTDTAYALIFITRSGGPRPQSVRTEELIEAILAAPATAETRASLAEAIDWICSSAGIAGEPALGAASYLRLVEIGRSTPPTDLYTQRWVTQGTLDYSFFFRPAPWTAAQAARRCLQQCQQVGDQPTEVVMRIEIGMTLCDLGELETAEEIFNSVWLQTRESQMQVLHHGVACWLVIVCCRSLRAEQEARCKRLAEVVDALLTSADQVPLFSGFAHLGRATLHHCAGRAEQAMGDAARAYELMESTPAFQRIIAAGRLHLLTEQGRREQALCLALKELAVVEAGLAGGFFELPVRSECIRALCASGELARARSELEAALRRIQIRLTDTADPGQRLSYLTNNPDCALIRKLSVALVGTDPIESLLSTAHTSTSPGETAAGSPPDRPLRNRERPL